MSNVIGAVFSIRDNFSSQIRGITGAAEEAQKSLKDTAEDASKLGSSMMKGITLPIVAGITASIHQFAKLEQSVGGIETLFKDSASAVITNSETAYKRAGVSANDYMESVTSFSASLLQGLGGDTEKAAKIADMAMVDMSDNANKFGSDIESVQNAYQGFAKGNFTMLDNLKLGFGGTAGEMARLINASGVMGSSFKATEKNVKDIGFDKMIEAINAIQTEMGVTGTTSKEAMETVAGSMGMAKSSIQDFLGGLGNSKADIGQLSKNVIESVTAVVKNVKGVLSTMLDNIPLAGWQKNMIAAAALFGPVLMVVSKIILIGPAIATAFGVIISPIGIVAGLIVGLGLVFMNLWKTNEEFRNKVISIWDSVKEKISDVIASVKSIFEVVFPIIQDIVFNALNVIKRFWSEHGSGIMQTVSNAFNLIKNIFEVVFSIIQDVVFNTLTVIKRFWSEHGSDIMQTVSNAFNLIKNIFKIALTVIGVTVTVGLAVIVGVVTVGLAVIKKLWDIHGQTILTIIKIAWDLIQSLIQGAMKIVQGIIDVAMGVMTGDWSRAWEGFKSIVSGIWDGIVGIITAGVNSTILLVNELIGMLNKIKLPDFLGGAGISMPEINYVGEIGKKRTSNLAKVNDSSLMSIRAIPALSKGTDNWGGGIAQIHERGGEIIDLPNGSRVYPHDETVNMARNQGRKEGTKQSGSKDIVITGNTFHVRKESDIKEIAKELIREIKDAEKNMS